MVGFVIGEDPIEVAHGRAFPEASGVLAGHVDDLEEDGALTGDGVEELDLIGGSEFGDDDDPEGGVFEGWGWGWFRDCWRRRGGVEGMDPWGEVGDHQGGHAGEAELGCDGVVECGGIGEEGIGVLACEEGVSGVGEIDGAEGVDESAEATPVQGIDGAVAVAGDDGLAGGHGLEEDDAEALFEAGHDEDVGEAVVIEEFVVGDLAGENDVVSDAEGGSHFQEAGLIRA